MNPQLVMTEFAGRHQQDLDHTRGRLLKGTSWKKQRVILILPASIYVPAKAMISWWNLCFPPNQGVYKVLAQGMEVGEAYSVAIEQILAHPELSQWEYILTIEHDNMPPTDGVLSLIAQMEAHPELSCIGGLYFTKGEQGVAQIWGDVRDPILNFRPQIPVAGQLVECCGTGMGFNLWRIAMFKDERLKRPWFRTVAGKEGMGTQDLVFWSDARKYGYRCAIDCAVAVGHLDAEADIIW
jgi:hypothetical protein